MTIYVDIDDTICKTPKKQNGEPDYENAKPLAQRIRKINELFEQGYIINYWTARGTLSGRDLQSLTKSFSTQKKSSVTRSYFGNRIPDGVAVIIATMQCTRYYRNINTFG